MPAKIKKSPLSNFAKLPSNFSSAEDIVEIPIKDIAFTSDQTRRYIDPESLARLTESIAQQGVLIPILVRPTPNTDFPYELVWGQKRLKACTILKKTTIKAICRSLTREEALEAALIENLQRDELNPVDETEGILKYLELKTEQTRDEIISLLYAISRKKESANHMVSNLYEGVGKRSLSTFTVKYLPLLKIEDSLLDLIRSGKLDFSRTIVLSRIQDKTLQERLIELILDSNLFTHVILQALQRVSKKDSKLAGKLAEELHKGNIETEVFLALSKVGAAEGNSEAGRNLAYRLLTEILAGDLENSAAAIKGQLENKPQKPTKKELQKIIQKVQSDSNIWEDEKKIAKLGKIMQELEQLL